MNTETSWVSNSSISTEENSQSAQLSFAEAALNTDQREKLETNFEVKEAILRETYIKTTSLMKM